MVKSPVPLLGAILLERGKVQPGRKSIFAYDG